MTGEMSKPSNADKGESYWRGKRGLLGMGQAIGDDNLCIRPNYPDFFALQDSLRRAGLKAEVQPFDVYQGPYVLVENQVKVWKVSDDGVSWAWFITYHYNVDNKKYFGNEKGYFTPDARDVVRVLKLIFKGGAGGQTGGATIVRKGKGYVMKEPQGARRGKFRMVDTDYEERAGREFEKRMDSWYVDYSSIFPSHVPYNIELMSRVAKLGGAKNVRADNLHGWSNQPKVLIFDTTEARMNDIKDEITRQLGSKWPVIIRRLDWRDTGAKSQSARRGGARYDAEGLCTGCGIERGYGHSDYCPYNPNRKGSRTPSPQSACRGKQSARRTTRLPPGWFVKGEKKGHYIIYEFHVGAESITPAVRKMADEMGINNMGVEIYQKGTRLMIRRSINNQVPRDWHDLYFDTKDEARKYAYNFMKTYLALGQRQSASRKSGHSIEKDVFTSTRPFRNFQNFRYHLYDVYGEGFTTTDGRVHYRARLTDMGRGNVRVHICETSGKGFHSVTADYGCKTTILDATMKRKRAHQAVIDFVKKNDLFHLPLKDEERNIFYMITDPSQRRHFEEIEHGAIGFPDNRHPTKEFNSLVSKLKKGWYYATWGEANNSIPSAGVVAGRTAIEYFRYRKL